MGKIFVRSRDVKWFPEDSEHLYIIYETEDNKRRVLRGGPTNDGLSGLIYGNINVIDEAYEEMKVDGDTSYPPDWDYDNSHKSFEIFNGTDEQMLRKVELMHREKERINREKYDYNLPWIEALIGDGFGDYNDQNSNTVVIHLANSCNLKDEVLTFITEKGIAAPGYLSELKHSKLDRTIDSLVDALIKNKKDVVRFINDLTRGVKTTLSDALEDDGNKKFIESLIKNISKKNKKVDSEKPILVLKESDTGRNELFIDQLTGKIMERELFVTSINKGDYLGYRVVNMNGLDTPVSVSDSDTSNNLG